MMDERQGIPWLEQDGPEVAWHIEADGSLHIVLRCERPTEIMNGGDLTDPVETRKVWDAVARHQRLAGCACLAEMTHVLGGVRLAVAPPFDADAPSPTEGGEDGDG